MGIFTSKNHLRGQSALEYLLLMAIVALVVVFGFKSFLPRAQSASEGYYNQVSRAIMGGGTCVQKDANGNCARYSNDPVPVNGGWCPAYCPPASTCGTPAITRTCACPSPAFGGSYCKNDSSGGAIINCKPQGCVDTACQVTSCNASTPTTCGVVNEGFDNCGNRCTNPASGVATACGSCPAQKPTSGTLCPGSDAQVPAGTLQWTLVTDCGDGGKCEYQCNSSNTGTQPDSTGTSCVPFYCLGTPPQYANLCPEADQVDSYGYTAHVIGNDSSACPVIHDCSYYCSPGHHAITGGGSCVSNQCSLTLPAGTQCPSANINVPTDGQAWTAVTTCNAGACTYLSCPSGQHVDSTNTTCTT